MYNSIHWLVGGSYLFLCPSACAECLPGRDSDTVLGISLLQAQGSSVHEATFGKHHRGELDDIVGTAGRS